MAVQPTCPDPHLTTYETEPVCWFWIRYKTTFLLFGTVGCLCYGHCAFPMPREICGRFHQENWMLGRKAGNARFIEVIAGNRIFWAIYIQCEWAALKSLISTYLFRGHSDLRLVPRVASSELLSCRCWITKRGSSLKGQMDSAMWPIKDETSLSPLGLWHNL